MKTTWAVTGGLAVLMTALVGAAMRGDSPTSAAPTALVTPMARMTRASEPRLQGAAVAGTPAAADLTAVTNKYCVTCHNQRMKTGGLMLDTEGLADVSQHAEVWEKVIRKVRGGFMPPGGSPRPDAVVLNQWVTNLEQAIDRAAAARPNPGRYRRSTA